MGLTAQLFKQAWKGSATLPKANHEKWSSFLLSHPFLLRPKPSFLSVHPQQVPLLPLVRMWRCKSLFPSTLWVVLLSWYYVTVAPMILFTGVLLECGSRASGSQPRDWNYSLWNIRLSSGICRPWWSSLHRKIPGSGYTWQQSQLVRKLHSHCSHWHFRRGFHSSTTQLLAHATCTLCFYQAFRKILTT